MVDFAVLPPEVTSGRMYAGSGSGPLVAAAGAWDRLAATLGSAAESYRAVVLGLTDESWQGPASASMVAAAQPYVEWMSTTAAQAAAMATQTRVAAAAFEAAHAAVVPPPVIAANRAALSSLVAGNVLGQNSGAIAANQAEYSAMWAQDAAVMQTYAAGSAAAVKPLEAFSPAPQTTNPAAAAADPTPPPPGPLTQLAQDILNVPIVKELSGFLGSVDGWDQNIVVGGLLDGFIQYSFIVPQIVGAETAALSYGSATGLIGTAASVSEGAEQFTLAGSATATTGAGAGVAGAAAGAAGSNAGGGITAGLGRATPVGGLSVPASWAPTARDVRLAVAALPASAAVAAPPGGMPMSGGWLGGIPPMAGMVNAPRGVETGGRSSLDPSPKVVPALARPGGADGDSQRQAARPGQDAAAAAAPTGRRAELDRLRKLAGELAKERDVLEQSAESLLELAGVRPDGPRR